MLGSYYQSTPGYYQNPKPYDSSDIGAPVPGWGTSVSVAGGARVGVGAAPAARVRRPSRATTRMTPWQTRRPPTPVPTKPHHACVNVPSTFDCPFDDSKGVRVDLHCGGGNVMRYEKGTMPQQYTPVSTSFGAYGAIDVAKAREAAERTGAIRRTQQAAPPPPQPVIGEQVDVGGLPWWVWPVGAAVVLGGVGYYGTKQGWF